MLRAVFWDMDGTLINSEPYWHGSEIHIATMHGGYWDEELAESCSGTPVPHVAARMVEHGTQLPVETIGRMMIEYVTDHVIAHMPWIEGVGDVLRELAQADIPCVLVTTSPRHLAEYLIRQAPDHVFAGYICGDDPIAKKPDPAPYLAAARLLGIGAQHMHECIAVEDSPAGLQAAAASGATTLAQRLCITTDTSQGPQFASITGYEGITVATFNEYIHQRALHDSSV